MDGILIIDKPAGITSHDVVFRVRRLLKTKRVGHTGTLDPFATGVMVILVGQATRMAQFLDKDAKEYVAAIRFGFETDTGDLTGNRLGESSVSDEDVSKRLTGVDWDATFAPFRGAIQQVPPMYSAKKIDGKKLYELARKGETVERKAADVTIHQLELLGNEPLDNPAATINVLVACSAGTYIRTLAEDIGRKVGIGAHLTGLRRTKAGKFTIEQSITLEQLAELADPATALIAIETAVSHLPIFTVATDRVTKTRNGMSTRVYDQVFSENEPISMVDDTGKLLAVGFFDTTENAVQPKVVLV